MTVAPTIRLLALGLALLAGAASAQSPDADAVERRAGLVQDLVGRAQARTGTDLRELTPLAPVFVEDLVRTGARARLALTLGAETVLKLGPGAEIRLESHLVDRGGEIELISGGLVFDSDEDAPPTDVSIRSAYAVMAVRGTRFFAGPSAGVFGVFVERGLVSVTAGGETVTLTEGLGTNIETPGDTPSAPASWPAERVASAFAGIEGR